MKGQRRKVRPAKYDEKKVTRRLYSAMSYHYYRCLHVRQAINRGDDVFTPKESEIEWHDITLCSRCKWIEENEDRFEEVNNE